MKHKSPFLFIFTLLLLLCNSLTVQAEDYRFQVLSVADGLPSIEVMQIFQQSNGYIWFATDSGASRYDGKNFKTYEYFPDNPNHFSNNFINQIAEDESGNLWVATDDGLNKLTKNGEVKIYVNSKSDKNSIATNWIITLFVDSTNNVWVGTGSGVFLYDPSLDGFTPIKVSDNSAGEIHSIAIHHIIEDAQNRILVTTSEGLKILDKQSMTLKPYISKKALHQDLFSGYFNAIMLDSQGDVWIASDDHGLFILDSRSDEVKLVGESSIFVENLINTFAEVGDDEIWLGLDDGGYIYSKKLRTFRRLTWNKSSEYSLPGETINDIFVDHSGLTWLSTSRGVASYSPLKSASQIINKNSEQLSLTDNYVYGITFDKGGNVWLANNTGLNFFDIEQNLVKQYSGTQVNNNLKIPQYIWGAAVDSKENIWLAGAEGLSVFNKNSQSLVNYSHEQPGAHHLPKAEYYTILIDDQDGVWLTGYQGVGLIHFDPDKGVLNQYLHEKGNRYRDGGNHSYDMLQTKNGDIWLATTDGVYRVTPSTGKIHHYNLSKNQSAIRATSISEDLSGNIWVATQGSGLVKLSLGAQKNQVQLEFITIDYGLTDNRIKTVAVDNNDNIWFTSQNKLMKFDHLSKRVTVFSSLIGDPSLTFLDASITILNNNLLIGTDNGLVKIDLSKIETNQFSPPVHITDIRSGDNANNQINKDKYEQLPSLLYEQNTIQFSFAALDYTSPKLNQYQYQLEGFNDSWINAGNKTTVMYTNLDAGTYAFKVRGSNSDGLWSSSQATFHFEVNRAWWFYTLWGLFLFSVLLTIIGLVSNFRLRKMKELRRIANIDSLTGLANRYKFNREINTLINETVSEFALVFLDLDNFKHINDSMGHDVGDEYIIKVAKRLQGAIRPGDLLARLGGDEFAMVITNYENEQVLQQLLNRLPNIISNNYQVGNYLIKGTASIGVSCFPQDGNSCEVLLKNADMAMYASKDSGKNKISYFNDELSQQLLEQIYIRNHLDKALKEDQFKLYYQPKICCSTGNIVGFEALLRWIHPEKGFISPEKFIPEAEHNGMIIEIGNWVLRTACKQASVWHKQGLLAQNVSVNLSPLQLFQPNIVEQIKTILEETGLPAQKLELEITESVFIKDVKKVVNVLQGFRESQIKIALDDFGTGYSSLNYLTKFSLNTLKIDRSFVQDCQKDAASLKLLKIIFQLAKNYDMEVVAEGVETIEQLKILQLNKCQWVQGYLYSPAVNADQSTQLLLSQQKHLEFQPPSQAYLGSCPLSVPKPCPI